MENTSKVQATESEIKGGKVIETIKAQSDNISDEKLKIKRHKFDSITIFEISESELETIERGSPTSVYLNFAIFLVSIAVSFLIAVLTGDYTNKAKAYTVLVLITIVGFTIGIFLFILWLTTRNDFNETIKKIRERII